MYHLEDILVMLSIIVPCVVIGNGLYDLIKKILRKIVASIRKRRNKKKAIKKIFKNEDALAAVLKVLEEKES